MKTVKEGAREYALMCKLSSEPQPGIEDVFMAGVKFAQRWISIDDELPTLSSL
jgi:hypothetical protein